MIDFSGLDNHTQKAYDIAPNYTVDDLRCESNESIDFMLNILRDLTDADVTFDPLDPEADDPYAKEGEEIKTPSPS